MGTFQSYDHPNRVVRREAAGRVGQGAANEVGFAFLNYQACKAVAIHAKVLVAGTTTGHEFTVRNGTTSIGGFVMGTSALAVSSSITLNSSLASLTNINVKQGADLTGCVAVCLEWQADADASYT